MADFSQLTVTLILRSGGDPKSQKCLDVALESVQELCKVIEGLTEGQVKASVSSIDEI